MTAAVTLRAQWRMRECVAHARLDSKNHYMVERSTEGRIVLNWKFKLFYEATSVRYVNSVMSRRIFSMMIADYFDGVLHFRFLDREIDAHPLFFKNGANVTPNMRKLGELSHALLGAGDRERLVERLGNLSIFNVYASDKLLVSELLGYWRDIEDVRDPVEVYTEALDAMESKVVNKEDKVQLIDQMDKVVNFFNLSARYDAAIALCTRSLKLKQSVYGDDNAIELAADMDALGLMYGRLGRYEEALPLHEQSMKILKEAHGDEDPRVAVSLNNLASLHQSLGNFDMAVEMYETVLETFTETSGEDSVEVGIILCNMGSLYGTIGDNEGAHMVLSKALPILEAQLGAKHNTVTPLFYAPIAPNPLVCQ
ncbi:hypothetical protein CYMTET_36457, partial [Cymbomonas tetramitiformis]